MIPMSLITPGFVIDGFTSEGAPLLGRVLSFVSRRSALRIPPEEVRRSIHGRSKASVWWFSVTVRDWLLRGRLPVGGARTKPSLPGVLRCVQNFTDFAQDRIRREGLLKEGRTGVEHTLVDDGIIRITRHIQYLHSLA